MGDNTPRNIGLPMLIVVLVSICLFSFAGIAYSTAQHSYKQSLEIKERTDNYYSACNEAEKMLADLTSIPETETTYSFPFGMAMEELQVTVSPDDSEKGYRVTGWVISDTASWEAPVDLGSGDDPQGPSAPGAGPQGPSAPGAGPQGPSAPEAGPQAPQAGPQAPAE